MVLGFGDPTKGMTRIWGHFVILDVCECVILSPQIMLIIYIGIEISEFGNNDKIDMIDIEVLPLFEP